MPKLTDKDTIVLSDFDNKTGDPVFDGTLRQGLTVQLQQSPFLSLVSDQRIQEALHLMEQSGDAKLTPEIAREVCQRTGSTTVIDGSIAQIGTRYSLILRAVNCVTGESLTSTEAEASDKSHVLDALGRAASEIRSKLGESLSTVEKFDRPLEQATTSSLEGLQAYSLGRKTLVAKFDSSAAMPLFQQAIQLDRNFAMAYASLGMCYSNLNETNLATENIKIVFVCLFSGFRLFVTWLLLALCWALAMAHVRAIFSSVDAGSLVCGQNQDMRPGGRVVFQNAESSLRR